MFKYQVQGLVNFLIEHHPKIEDIISNRYLKVMFKVPKMGHLPKTLIWSSEKNIPNPDLLLDKLIQPVTRTLFIKKHTSLHHLTPIIVNIQCGAP